MFRLGVLGLVILGVLRQAAAETATLHPAADTTLFEFFPDNNFGAYHLVAGTTAKEGTRSRALLKFVAGTSVPAGATITAVQLTLVVDRSPHGAESSNFELHRMLVDWTEGAGGKGNQTKGTAAKSSESTWNMRLASSTPWSNPGGEAVVEYAATLSASAPVANRMVFSSTPELVSDVQQWFDHPETNFGWMLMTASEDLVATARRFGSREAGTAPSLLVTFTVGPSQTAPEITTQPQDQTAFAGEDATFVVAAIGTLPPAYQWSFGQTSIADGTNATLIVRNAQAANAGSYSVEVSNPAGSLVSTPVALTIAPDPLINPITLADGLFNLNFRVEAQHNYSLQFLGSLPGTDWQTLTNFPAAPTPASVTIADPISDSRRFYRLRVEKAP